MTRSSTSSPPLPWNACASRSYREGITVTSVLSMSHIEAKHRGEPVRDDEPAEGYLLDNRQAEAGDRFTAISALFDDWTFRQVERLGIAPGWRCWEVGAGGP